MPVLDITKDQLEVLVNETVNEGLAEIMGIQTVPHTLIKMNGEYASEEQKEEVKELISERIENLM